MSDGRFFDEYPRFYESSQTAAHADRLNARHEAIIGRNRELLSGRRVLDLASHDGRWSFAALQAGARHITGIEARPHLIEHARETFSAYGVAPERYTFRQGDVFSLLEAESFEVDVVLCLGFMYHTFRHLELVKLLADTGARHVVVDTEIVPRELTKGAAGRDPRDPERLIWKNPFVVQLLLDPVEHEAMAVGDDFTREGHTPVGRPSAEVVGLLFSHFGFTVTEVDWGDVIAKGYRQVNDYAQGWRATFVASR
jgi:hypothetical protein